MRQLFFIYIFLFAIGCFAQNYPAKLSSIPKSISFYLFKTDNTRLIWYDIDTHTTKPITDSLFCNKENFNIEASITDSMKKNFKCLTSFSINDYPYIDSNLIFLPYDSLENGMIITIKITELLTKKSMIIKINYTNIDEDSRTDTYFRFNYIPFKEGLYVFQGKDITHWDVQTATINENNNWKAQSNSVNTNVVPQ